MAASTGETAVARGQRAEALAERYLSSLGYRTVARNVRYPGGEIDLIAWDERILCFIEVRARQTDRFGDPLETIGPNKVRRIVRAASRFIEGLAHPWPAMRFDALGIVLTDPPSMRLIRGAFETSP